MADLGSILREESADERTYRRKQRQCRAFAM